jgi:hypothetical protein
MHPMRVDRPRRTIAHRGIAMKPEPATNGGPVWSLEYGTIDARGGSAPRVFPSAWNLRCGRSGGR